MQVFFLRMGRAFLQNKFSTIYRLGSKIRQGENSRGWQTPPPLWTYFTNFSNHEDEIQSSQILV